MKRRSQDMICAAWDTKAIPLLSICCITYNHKPFIEQAINSFLMQETNFPFEIIVHDDASTDGTKEIILKYAKEYPKIIKVISQIENQYSKGGLINARILFPKTKGKYIALCEGDDYWVDKTKLQKQVDFLESNPEFVITYTDCQPFDENGNVDFDYGGVKKDLGAKDLKKAPSIATLTTCFRNVIKELPQDVLSAQNGDLIMWSLLGFHGKGKYMPNISPSAYRVHDGGVFSKKSKQQKHLMAAITKASLLAYYLRINDEEMVIFFKHELLRNTLLSIGWLKVLRVFFQAAVRKVKVYLRCKSG